MADRQLETYPEGLDVALSVLLMLDDGENTGFRLHLYFAFAKWGMPGYAIELYAIVITIRRTHPCSTLSLAYRRRSWSCRASLKPETYERHCW